MKVFIWIVCCFVLGTIQTLFKSAGILLGFIPTFILAGATFAAARALCCAWDRRIAKKKKECPEGSLNDPQKNAQNVPIEGASFFVPDPVDDTTQTFVDMKEAQTEESTEEKCLTVSSGRCHRPGDKTRISLYVVSSLLVISLIGFGIACPLLTQNAYASGYSEGYATGKKEGKNDGRHIGYNEGYRDGIGEYEEAYNKGFDEGLYHAYEDDSSQGFSLSEYVRDKRMWTKLHEEGKTDLSFR